MAVQINHLPGDRNLDPVWLWSSATGATAGNVDRWWQSYLRRFDLEHTFRLFKQTLGWPRPKIRTPEAADRWTWLIITAHAQLRLARGLVEDLRRPWEKPAAPADPQPHVFGAVPEHPPGDHFASQGPQTQHAGPRTPIWFQEPQASPTTRRRQDRHTRPHHGRAPSPHGLKNKLRELTPEQGR